MNTNVFYPSTKYILIQFMINNIDSFYICRILYDLFFFITFVIFDLLVNTYTTIRCVPLFN